MTKFANLATKRVFVIIGIFLSALIAEFLILEGTIGIGRPSDRYSALSSLEIKVQGRELHFITRNKRFTVVDLLKDHGTHIETLVLRESFFMDREDGVEGPPVATITVEAMSGKNVKWTIHEPGQRGDALTDNLYRVSKFGCCDTPPIHTYFSLADGRKVRTNNYAELSRGELEALDLSIAK